MIREIKENEINVLLDLIKEMAKYEKLEHQVIATEESLYDSLFIKKGAHASLIYEDNQVCGYLVYFYNFSTFTGSLNLYVEDIFIKEKFRKKGYGKSAFIYLAKKAMAENVERIDWVCLDWNQKGLDFYQRIGANKLDCWVYHRLEKDAIEKLAKEEL